MAGRVNPLPPEKPDKLQQPESAASERAIEKVREVDPDDPRKKHFQGALNNAEKRLKTAKESSSKLQSPFALCKEGSQRHGVGKSLLGSSNQGALPTPESAPPPNVALTPPSPPFSLGGEESSPLPRSQQFWSDIDEPPDQPLSSQPLQENAASISHGDAKPKKKQSEEEPETVEAPAKRASDKETNRRPETKDWTAEQGQKEFEAKKLKPEELAPKATHRQELDHTKPTPKPSLEGAFHSPATPHKPALSPAEARKMHEKEVSTVRAAEAKGKREGEEHKAKQLEMVDPAYPPLPKEVDAAIQPTVQTATPYLSTEALSLFYRMAGMIHVMAGTPGVSRTEIVLNSPSFASSRFFGSTITIERYASAPNAVNIRLSGSNEAVKAFNDNIASLASAFEQSKLPMRVQRIEATYSSERVDRPVLHRKRDLGGGADQRGQR